MILAGDIGGTNSRLAIFEIRRGRMVMCCRADTPNKGQKNFIDIVRRFLDSTSHVAEIACFGVAGPVKDGRVTLTNLSWTLDEKKLARGLGIRHVALINDLVAHAEGTNVLGNKQMLVLRQGRPARGGNRAIIAPGTGLGEGGLVFDAHSHDYRAFPSEGGHCDFAPRDAREIALMQFLRKRLGRCSWEDVLSGPGLRNIFDFITAPGKFRIPSKLKTRAPKPAEITAAANDGSCRACVAAVQLFAILCGAEGGNLALKTLASGGVYIGGGIPSRILKFFRKPEVLRAFSRKGPPSIQKLLDAIPIRVITSSDNALYGAAHFARRI